MIIRYRLYHHTLERRMNMSLQSNHSSESSDTDPMMKQQGSGSSKVPQVLLWERPHTSKGRRGTVNCLPSLSSSSCSFTTTMSPPSAQRPTYSLPQEEAGGMWNVVCTAVDDALDIVLPNDYSTTTRSTGSISSPLVVNPTPIQPSGIQVVQTVPLSATWQDLNNGTDLIQWVFTTPSQSIVVARTEENEEKEENYEPLDAFSSNHADDVLVVNNLNDADNIITPAGGGGGGGGIKSPKREKWEDRFQELLQYRTKFGNCLVPHSWVGNKKLSSWVKRQRYQYRLWCTKEHSTLNKERIEILNKVGFVWSSHHAIWEEKLKELEEFSIQHGHCNVPSRYAANQQLAIWVRSQRRQYKLRCQQQQQQRDRRAAAGGAGSSGNEHHHHHHHHQKQSYMTMERFEKLQSLGFVFDPRRLVSQH